MGDSWTAAEALRDETEVVERGRSGAEKRVVYTHLRVPPVQRDVVAPPVVVDLLAQSDGAALFCPAGTRVDDLGLDYEAILFDAAEIHEETLRLREQLVGEIVEVAQDGAGLDDEHGEVDEAALRRSIDQLWTIGVTMHGDPLVIERWDSTDICIFEHHFLLGNLIWSIEIVRCEGLEGLFSFLAARLEPVADPT